MKKSRVTKEEVQRLSEALNASPGPVPEHLVGGGPLKIEPLPDIFFAGTPLKVVESSTGRRYDVAVSYYSKGDGESVVVKKDGEYVELKPSQYRVAKRFAAKL